jgi:hypothetical protein
MRLIEAWLKVYDASGQAQYQPDWSVQMSGKIDLEDGESSEEAP